MSWFSNISNTIGSIMEVMAPMPEEQQKLEIIQKVQEERRDSTTGVGARLVAQRALGADSPFQSPFKSQQLVDIRNSSNVGDATVKTPTVSIQTNISNFSKNNEMKIDTNNNYSTPSPSLNYSSNTPLSPFLKPTAVPETIVQQAGDAAIVTAQYLQAQNTTSLNKHYKDFFKHCGAQSASVKEKYLENLRNQLKIDPKLVYARSTLSRSADEFGWTGLHFAAKQNNIGMMETLLSFKADPMAVDVRGCTPLHVAAKNHRLDACKRLMQAMQDANDGKKPVGKYAPVDLRGFTPAIYAKITKAIKDRNIDNSIEDAEKRKVECQSILYAFGDRHISPRNPSPSSLRKNTLHASGSDLPQVENPLTYTHQWMKGWRENFEDSYIADVGNSKEDLCIFGIFDGHLGSFTSQYCAENLQRILNKNFYIEMQKAKVKAKKELYEDIESLSEILKATFFQLDQQLRENPMLSGTINDNTNVTDSSTADVGARLVAQRALGINSEKKRKEKRDDVGITEGGVFRESAAIGEGQAKAPDQSGSTAVVVLITPQYIITANVGDSRAVLRTCSARGQTIPLNRDHNYQLPDEVARVEKAGGVFKGTRLFRSSDENEKRHLSMTRAIGDFYYKDQKNKNVLSQVVLPVPEISVYKRCKEDALLLVACDGIWDVMDNSAACEKVLENKDDIDEGVFQLMVECMDRGSTDNMSAIAVLFDHVSQAHLPTYLKHEGTYFQCDWDKSGAKIYNPYTKTSKVVDEGVNEMKHVGINNVILRPTPAISNTTSANKSTNSKGNVTKELGRKLEVQRSKIDNATSGGVTINFGNALNLDKSKKDNIVDESSGASNELAEKLKGRRDSMNNHNDGSEMVSFLNQTFPAPVPTTLKDTSDESHIDEMTDVKLDLSNLSLESISLNSSDDNSLLEGADSI
jgi:serine/threonine protein phosphatase PrpC/ankyrin repeat protein